MFSSLSPVVTTLWALTLIIGLAPARILRGCYGTPRPYLDLLLRLNIFLVIMNLLTFVLDTRTVLVLSALYALPYLIPSEQYGGRANFPFAWVSRFAHFVLRRGVGDFLESMEMKNKEGILKGSIICAHPHGALPLGFAANLLTTKKDLTLS